MKKYIRRGWMITERKPAEATHPSVFICEELAERGWTIETLFNAMGVEHKTARYWWRFYVGRGSFWPEITMAQMDMERLARAFGSSVGYWRALQDSYLAAQKREGG